MTNLIKQLYASHDLHNLLLKWLFQQKYELRSRSLINAEGSSD